MILRRSVALAIAAVALAAASLAAGEALLDQPVLALLAGERAEAGAWVSAVGGGQAGLVGEGAGRVLALAGDGRGQGAMLGFHRHQSLALPAAPAGASLHLRLALAEVPAAAPAPWRAAWRRADGALGEIFPLVLAREGGAWMARSAPLPAPAGPCTGLQLVPGDAGAWTVARIELVAAGPIALEPLARDALFAAAEVRLAGAAAPGIASVELRAIDADDGSLAWSRTCAVERGRFAAQLPGTALHPARLHRIEAVARPGGAATSPCLLFAYPPTGAVRLPRLTVEGGRLQRDGRPWGAVGVNFTPFSLGLTRKRDYELLARAVDTMAAWGVGVVRVTLEVGAVQADEGVFPGDPRWEAAFRSRGLDPDFVSQLDWFIAQAARRGIYTLLEWHQFPTRPYRHFLGGDEKQRGSGVPGTAIAWLAEDRTVAEREFDPALARHRRALLASHAWLAEHYAGDPNLLGIEVPFNEPHDDHSAVPANWARLAGECGLAVKRQDPDRLTWSMPSAWGHDNVTPGATWDAPMGVDGAAPHFYLANGPLPMRADARTAKEPWLCREVAPTFALSLPAVFLPLSAAPVPLINGEGGDHGHRTLLPDLAPAAAVEAMVDATLAQTWMSGCSVSLLWMLWPGSGSREGFHGEIYARQLARFAPVFSAGAIARADAEVLFIQHPAAAPAANGLNHACLPFLRLIQALHLGSVHYQTDEQVVATGLGTTTAGFEQARTSAAALARYRAIVVDTRQLDPRVAAALDTLAVPVLRCADPDRLEAGELAALLAKAGVAVDRRTPASVQLGVGPEHLVAFQAERRDGPVTIFPRVPWRGAFRLLDEQGRERFAGTAAQLAEGGVAVAPGAWRSAILRRVAGR